MIGRASAMYIADAGTITSAARRMPRETCMRSEGDVVACRRAGHLGCERGHQRHREQAVRKLEERVRADVDERPAVGAVGQDRHDQQRDLVGDDVPHRPSGEPQHQASPRDGASSGGSAGACAGARAAGAARAPSRRRPPSCPARGGGRGRRRRGRCAPSASRRRGAGARGTPRSATMLLSTGANAAARNRRRALSIAVASVAMP